MPVFFFQWSSISEPGGDYAVPYFFIIRPSKRLRYFSSKMYAKVQVGCGVMFRITF